VRLFLTQIGAIAAIYLIIGASAAVDLAGAAPQPSAPPVPATGRDFRAAVWGQARSEIRRQETGAPYLDLGPLLGFRTTVAGQPCQVIYLFQDDQLCMGFYQWSDTNGQLAPYFGDAATRREELVDAWGEPAIEHWDWDDPMFSEEPSERAQALGLGLVRYEMGWLTGRSLIALRLSGGSLKADLVVMYADKTCFPAGQELYGQFFANKVGEPQPYYR
jgi:hypothetical protein